MTQARVLVMTGLALVLCASCAGTKKVELEYEEPVTKTWTGAQPPAQPEPAAQQLPPAAMPPPGPRAPAPQPPPPSPGAWRSPPPASAPPLNFPDPSATTVVVPEQNPTTQTTLKKRSTWVRGGYD